MTLADYISKTGRKEAELAAAFKCSQGTVNKLKLGKQWPSLELVRRIALATDGRVNPNDFAGVSSDKDGEVLV